MTSDARLVHTIVKVGGGLLGKAGAFDLVIEALTAFRSGRRLVVIPGGGHLLNRSPSAASWDIGLSIDTPEAWAATIDFLDHTIGGDL